MAGKPAANTAKMADRPEALSCGQTDPEKTTNWVEDIVDIVNKGYRGYSGLKMSEI